MHIIGICGFSGSGKTTLLKQLIPLLKQYGIRLAVIKHSHHNMDIDLPGKDSYELRKSGADQVIVASNQRWALISETPNNPPNLINLASHFNQVDLVLVEGFKDEAISKIVCHRQANQQPIFYDENTLAIASDVKLPVLLPQLDLNNIQSIGKWIYDYITKMDQQRSER